MCNRRRCQSGVAAQQAVLRDGQYKINLRVDPELRKGMNADGYSGPVENRQNIGIDNLTLKAQWDLTHPDDPLEL